MGDEREEKGERKCELKRRCNIIYSKIAKTKK